MSKKSPARIMISGYYGFGNAGDEAILAAIIQDIRRHLPDARIVVLSERPGETAAEYRVESHQRKDVAGIFRLMGKMDLFVSGGGGLVQDSTGFSTVAYYLGLVQMARLRGKKVMCYAQGFGPLAQAKSRAMARFVMSQASLITFRDENSLALAREIGITRPPIHVTADPVFGLEPPGNERMGPILESEGITGEGHRLGVSVRPWKSGADYAAAVAAAADSFAGRHGARVFLFPFQHSQDMDVCREVASKMKEKARVVEKPYPATVLMGLMGRMSMILGMRLHSLIFSAAQGIPSAGISYDPKVSSMMDLVGLPWVDIDTVSADGLLGMMENAFQAGAGHGLAERTARLKELARKNGELLAGLLQG